MGALLVVVPPQTSSFFFLVVGGYHASRGLGVVLKAEFMCCEQTSTYPEDFDDEMCVLLKHFLRSKLRTAGHVSISNSIREALSLGDVDADV